MAAQARVRLRRVTLGDAALLERWQAPDFTGEFKRFGLPPRPLRAAIQEHGLVTDEAGTLIVELVADATPVGTVSWRAFTTAQTVPGGRLA